MPEIIPATPSLEILKENWRQRYAEAVNIAVTMINATYYESGSPEMIYVLSIRQIFSEITAYENMNGVDLSDFKIELENIADRIKAKNELMEIIQGNEGIVSTIATILGFRKR